MLRDIDAMAAYCKAMDEKHLTERLNLRVRADVPRKLRMLAAAANKRIGAYVSDVIDREFQRREGKRPK